MTPGQSCKFGTTPDGDDVVMASIGHGGLSANIMTWGASLQDLRLAHLAHSLTLGSPVFDPYLAHMKYYGAIVGPVANRVEDGRFTLDGQTHDLDRNENGITTLHGGAQGMGQSNWTLADLTPTSCTMTIAHADGHCGFPGNIDITAVYEAQDDATLVLTIRATTDRPTHFNAAFHGLWNLDGTADLSRHSLRIPADDYLPVDDRLIPLGAPAAVAGTDFDYRTARAPGRELDHNFCLSRSRGDTGQICELSSPAATLTIYSTEPGLQVYCGRMIDTAPWGGHGGHPYRRYAGIALEPQCWPNSPNEPAYPSTRLNPGQTYVQMTKFAFS